MSQSLLFEVAARCGQFIRWVEIISCMRCKLPVEKWKPERKSNYSDFGPSAQF